MPTRESNKVVNQGQVALLKRKREPSRSANASKRKAALQHFSKLKHMKLLYYAPVEVACYIDCGKRTDFSEDTESLDCGGSSKS